MKKTIFDKIDSAKANREATLKELESKRSECENEQIRKANEASEILANGTAEDYSRAKAESREASDKIEFYTKRIEELKSSPLFDKKELDYYVKEIQTYTDQRSAEHLKKICSALSEAKSEAIERTEILRKADRYISEINGNSTYLNDIVASNSTYRTIQGEIDRPMYKAIK